MPKSYILVPGYGAQGGKGADLVHFFNKDGLGAIVNSSRGIIAAYKQEAYAKFGAENFGVHSAMAVTTFGIATFYVRKRWMKVYFAIITICAIYGMGISGTRAAMAVPFGGIALFILVSKSWKSFALSTLAFIAVFSFFIMFSFS